MPGDVENRPGMHTSTDVKPTPHFGIGDIVPSVLGDLAYRRHIRVPAKALGTEHGSPDSESNSITRGMKGSSLDCKIRVELEHAIHDRPPTWSAPSHTNLNLGSNRGGRHPRDASKGQGDL